MIPRLSPARRGLIIAALGSSLTVSWASSYCIPAVLAVPMAEDLGLSPVWVFGAFSMAMVVSAMVGPWAGARIDVFGGRGVLMLSNFVFAAGLGLLAMATTPLMLFAGWAVIGLGMGIGLYEAGFATLAGIYGKEARGPITGITLIAGFASTVGWPLSGLMLAAWGWREACIGWALIHLAVAFPLNAWLPKGTKTTAASTPVEDGPPPSRMALWLLAFVFAATWFNSTAMAAHLPGLLQAAGASTTVAIAAGALIGPAQVAARVLEFGLLRRFHPLVSTRVAAAAHPLAAVALVSGRLCLRVAARGGERHPHHRQGHAAAGAVWRGGIREADRLAQCARPYPSGGSAPDLWCCADSMGRLGDLVDGGNRPCSAGRSACAEEERAGLSLRLVAYPQKTGR
ncbi:Major Facilitator Superfamily protein [Celeribacter baekdonensis]|uniref:Major Facilitator Superfamily protein n=1 Tax=Celeribacter baekdonensis TaxID=875171 RepID=A0A1G7Q637_9RHOB|nr:MFS transporter [Celeribacter baekdonensis]SDF93925.1 Major Facilitator Superfamily protein [Celeribacter baekdonensis]